MRRSTSVFGNGKTKFPTKLNPKIVKDGFD